MSESRASNSKLLQLSNGKELMEINVTESSDKDLSVDELRSRLFHSLRSKGLVNSVKSQLRNKLALELHDLTASKVNKMRSTHQADASLIQQLSNHLVADHLKSSKYDYTLSVFGPESLTNSAKKLMHDDILQILGISQMHPLYYKLIQQSASKGSKGFLWNFLAEISYIFTIEKSDVSSQTENNSLNGRTHLKAKLSEVEKAFESRTTAQEKGSDASSLEARLIAFQRQYEAKKREELTLEMERFRGEELQKLQLHHDNQARLEIEKARSELEDEYRRRVDALNQREKETQDRLYSQEKMLEEDAYKQRQMLLQEMQKNQEREMAMRHSHQLATKSVELEEQRLKSLADQLKLKEETLMQMDERCDQRVRDEVLRSRLELQEEHRKREEYLRVQEQQLREDKASFENQKGSYMKLVDDVETKREKIVQLEASLQTSKHTLAVVTQRYEIATERIKEMSDYERIKQKLLVAENQLTEMTLKVRELSSERKSKEQEYQVLMRDMLERASKPSADQDKIYSKMLQDKEDFLKKEMEYQDKVARLEEKYTQETRKNRNLQRQNEEQMFRQRTMLKEMAELKETMLGYKTEQKFTPSALPTTASAQRTEPTVGLDLRPTTSGLDHLQPHRSTRRKLWLEEDKLEDTARAKLRQQQDVFSKLEKEAAELERAYSDFQSRQTLFPQFSADDSTYTRAPIDHTALRQSQDRYFSMARLSSDIPERDTGAEFGSIRTKVSHISSKITHSPSTSNVMSSSHSHPLSSTQAPGANNPLTLGLSTMTLQSEFERAKLGSTGRTDQLVVSDLDNDSTHSHDHKKVHIKIKDPHSKSNITGNVRSADSVHLGPRLSSSVESNLGSSDKTLYKHTAVSGTGKVTDLRPNESSGQFNSSLAHPSSPTNTLPTCYSLTQEPIQNLSTTVANHSAATPYGVRQYAGIVDNGSRSTRDIDRLTPLLEHSYEGDGKVNDGDATLLKLDESRKYSGKRNSETDLGLRETALIALDSPTRAGSPRQSLDLSDAQPTFDRTHSREQLSYASSHRKSQAEDPFNEIEVEEDRTMTLDNEDKKQIISLDREWKEVARSEPEPALNTQENSNSYEGRVGTNLMPKKDDNGTLNRFGDIDENQQVTKSRSHESSRNTSRSEGEEEKEGKEDHNADPIESIPNLNPLMKQYMDMVMKRRAEEMKEGQKSQPDDESIKSALISLSAKDSRVSRNASPGSIRESTDDEFDWG